MNDELVERLRNYGDLTDSEVHSTRIEAADHIEALTAQLSEARESERAAVERAKLDGVRAGIEAAYDIANRYRDAASDYHQRVPDPCAYSCLKSCANIVASIRALDVEAIAKGEG